MPLKTGPEKSKIKDSSLKDTLQFDLFAPPVSPVQIKAATQPQIVEAASSEINEKEIEKLLKYNENDIEAAKLQIHLKSPPTEKPKEPSIYTVSELSKLLRDSLREFFPEVIIRGEIADFKGVHRNGHLYFSLKDDKAQIRAVMWKPAVLRVPFDIKGGLEVIAHCKIDYYAGSGSLQLVVERMDPVGLGALQLKLEQLKEKLKAEGLFEASRKKPVKNLNWRIGIVTSKTGAALFDMLRVYASRFPLVQIFVFHAAVQGEKAADEIVAALGRVEKWQKTSIEPLDLVVVTRGGGSYEDLFCFNDEKIVRALSRCTLPTVSAVGHEIDVTLADFVADKRSATPSHAASETVPELTLWFERLSEVEKKLKIWLRDSIKDRSQKVDSLWNRLVQAAPQKRISDQKALMNEKKRRFIQLMNLQIHRVKDHLTKWSSVMDALSPLKVLERGYSIVKKQGQQNDQENSNNQVVKSARDVNVGDRLQILLSEGTLKATVVEKT
jgi:exodeoxyribonuclease VII large subunit